MPAAIPLGAVTFGALVEAPCVSIDLYIHIKYQSIPLYGYIQLTAPYMYTCIQEITLKA